MKLKNQIGRHFELSVQRGLAAAWLFVGLLLVTTGAEAKVFRNAYVSFELADRWNCALEQTEWVCRTSQPGLAEAIVVLTAKEVGPQDALPGYESHLKQPRTIMGRSGGSIQSTVYKVEQRTILNHPWIDGMHLSSEVPNYYTRYVATTKDKIAVLVTFSAHKLHYTKYSADFFKAIESLRVIATRSLMQPGGSNLPDGMLGPATNVDLMPVDPNGAPEEGSGGSFGGGAARNFMALALVIGAVGVYLLLKRGQGGKKKRKK